MASCVLPPIRTSSPPPLPVVTFFSVPRRYVKSNMQVGDESSQLLGEASRSGRGLRKSTRIQIPRSAPNTSDVECTKEEEQTTPTSPRAVRKRNPSLDSDENAEESVKSERPTEVKIPASVRPTGSSDLSPHVCLCQPEPKIPRPRNAFILYRQHHQQTIIRRNPGLNNPDISKIIGEQWKAESDEEKKIWQDLAQDEKARHHELYPDYRYQPRRVSKPGSSPLNPSGQHTTVDKYRCPRCGGRSIKTPISPYPTESQGTPTLPPPNTSEGHTPTTRYLPMMSSLSLDSPVVARRGPGPSRLSNIQVPAQIREQDMYSPLTPGQKRRRYDYAPPPSARRLEGPYYPQSAARRESLPPIHVRVSPPASAGMHPSSARTPQERRLPIHELPNRKSSSASDINIVVPQHHDQSRSVEAMVLSVPYQARIKLLGRICAPLKEPGPTSPAAQTRGAIIAVEGDDLQAVQDLAQWLNEFLSKDEEYSSRIAEPPRTPCDSKKEVTFEEYLSLISEWHGKSKEMARYITAPISSSSPSPSKDEGMGTADRKDSATPPDSPRKPASPGLTTSPPTSSSAATKKPVLILPTFQLHASVTYASRIPIQDAYSPTDHWQWMATLWRGIVGPDLTLYVKSYDGKEQPQGKMVELDDSVRCLTVMKQAGGEFKDASLRRVGFEVSEWVRGLGRKEC